MQDNITGKTILLICDPHYGCDKLMEHGLKDLGAIDVGKSNIELE